MAALQKSRLPEYLLLVLVVEQADLYWAVTSELGAVVDPTHAAHRDVSSNVELLLEDISNLVET